MDFVKFVEWGFYGIVGFSCIFGVKILSSLNNSVSSLNIKVAVILEKIATHEKEIDKLHDRVSVIEQD